MEVIAFFARRVFSAKLGTHLVLHSHLHQIIEGFVPFESYLCPYQAKAKS